MAENKTLTSTYSEPRQFAKVGATLSITETKRLSDGKTFRNLVLEVAGRRFRLSDNTNFAEVELVAVYASMNKEGI